MTDKPENKSGSTMLDRWKYDHDTDWLGSAVVTPPPRCPECASTDVLPVLYGEPAPGVKGSMLAPKPDDEVALGGCMVAPDAPAWKCRACRHEFGTLAETRPGMFEEIENG